MNIENVVYACEIVLFNCCSIKNSLNDWTRKKQKVVVWNSLSSTVYINWSLSIFNIINIISMHQLDDISKRLLVSITSVHFGNEAIWHHSLLITILLLLLLPLQLLVVGRLVGCHVLMSGVRFSQFKMDWEQNDKVINIKLFFFF